MSPRNEDRAQGMSLRDYFAAQAMQALVTHYGNEGNPALPAYEIADQMLAARTEVTDK